MNEEPKKSRWQRTKEFFTKHWRSITAALAGFIALVFSVFKLFGPNRTGDNAVREQLDGLERDIDKAGSTAGELRDIHEASVDTATTIRDQASELRDGNRDAVEVSEDVGEGIQRIKRLIEAERERNKEAEV